MKKSILIILILFVSIKISYCQIYDIDSLNAVLKTKINDTTKINTWNALSWQYKSSNTDTAIYFANKALEFAKKIEYDKGISVAKRNIGTVYFIHGRMHEALTIMQEAQEINLRINDKYQIGKTYLMYGNIYGYLSEPDNEILYFEKALQIFTELDNKIEIAGITHNLAQTFTDFGNYTIAIEYYYKALEIEEKIGNELGIARTLGSIGSAYEDLGDYEKAMEYFKKALEYFEELGHKKFLSANYNNLAGIYTKIDKDSLALVFFNKALEINMELKDTLWISYNYVNMSDIYLKHNNFEKALEYLHKSKDLTDIIGVATDMFYIKLGYIQYIQKEYRKALQNFEKALEICMKNKTVEKIASVCLRLYKTHKKLNNTQKALEYLELNNNYLDSLEQTIDLKKIGKLEAKHNYEKVKQQMEYEQNQKDEILTQNEVLYQHKEEIEAQRDDITEHHRIVVKQKKNITDSIQYAKRIQFAALPSTEYIKKVLVEYFILFKPLDIVSGDFYWLYEKTNPVSKNIIRFVAVADCTGHGVPGAFVSMLGISLLNEIINRSEINSPSQLLESLRKDVKTALKQTGKRNESKDGMDIAVCAIDMQEMKLQYAGANNPLYIIRNEKSSEPQNSQSSKSLIIQKATKNPIGIYIKEKPFVNHEFDLYKNDLLYIFSDGFVDQFGGENGNKFMSKKFKKLLLSIADISMQEQNRVLDNTFEEWLGDFEQIDDVLVMGVKI